MRRLTIPLSIATLLFLPLLTSAQAENQPPQSGYCPHITQNLKRGDRDANTQGQVTELQKFLADYYDLDPADYVTGYFGRMTQRNVMRFQREQNLPAFGYVGPLTRAAIARVCGSTTIPIPPPATPPLPTCTLNINPSTITTGQSATLSWSSTNAAGGTITPGIGTVTPNGSQSVSPLMTTTFNGTFGTFHALAVCSATLTVTPQTTTNASCTFNNQTIAHGASVTAYQTSSVPAGQQCVSQTRTCQNGTLSGTYQYATCSVATATCTPEAPQTQTLSCPTGQTGSITQTRTSTCPGPTWGAWTTTSNTCTTPPPTNVGACIYKGQTYAEGTNITIDNTYSNPATFDVTCDNKIWSLRVAQAKLVVGMDVCNYIYVSATRTDLGCVGLLPFPEPLLIPASRHGHAPMTASIQTNNCYGPNYRFAYSIAWGDGRREDYPALQAACANDTSSHVYTTPGNYTISYTGTAPTNSGKSNSANIRVDGPVTLAPNQTQLASALASLESALKAILKLLE